MTKTTCCHCVTTLTYVVTDRQRSCGKVIFHKCLSVYVGRVSLVPSPFQGVRVYPDGRVYPPGGGGYCGCRYTSYWNDFLYFALTVECPGFRSRIRPVLMKRILPGACFRSVVTDDVIPDDGL